MESITAIIVTALALGAAAGLKDTTEQIITDGYEALKSLIKRKFPKAGASVDQLERAPESKARRAVVEEDLTQDGADQDAEVLQQAKALLDLIEERAPATVGVIGVDLSDIKAASLTSTAILTSEACGPDNRATITQSSIGSTSFLEGCRYYQLRQGLCWWWYFYTGHSKGTT